ncbi:hypothetical protein G8764_08480 [Pseudomaricurvus alcaniphilus]|uniref:tetratricopeptide repeat protein n=1 Tax=Pseudomaricurvus alcaniphilus TaxID=1166482 RepID=UPI00140E0518|nr:tetratricopeptide repeat protein [Pseudomaricurvus alcaniphilus]NHN37323.1 hypothetical protein [Pseudomaricurvus alcaniphilus]
MPPLVALLCLLQLLLVGCGERTGSDPGSQLNGSWIPDSRAQVVGRANPLELQPATTLQQALVQARTLIQRGQLSADPRYYGRAEALLAPWYSDRANPQVRVLMATILQRRHQFPAALSELQQVLAAQPDNPQALLSQAFVYRASGQLDQASSSCRRLRRLTQAVIALACEVATESDMSTPSRAFKALHYMLDHSPPEDLMSNQWAQRMGAVAAQSRGQLLAAERWFLRALDLTPDAPDLQAQWLDFLLDEARLDDAERFLQNIDAPATTAPTLQHDGLLLRRAIVGRRLGLEQWRADLQILRQRQALLAMRGEADLHLREQARQALELEDDPARALTLALDNWQLQREVADATLVLQAALQLQQPGAATGVIDWLRQQQVRHPRLQQLAGRLQQQQLSLQHANVETKIVASEIVQPPIVEPHIVEREERPTWQL